MQEMVDAPAVSFDDSGMKLPPQLERILRQSDKFKQQMVKKLLKTMRKIEQERKARTADLDHAAKLIGKQLADLGHRLGIPDSGHAKNGARKPRAGTKGKRVRRSAEQLKAEAERALGIIRKAGKDGVSGAQIRKVVPGIGQNIKTFVEKNAGEKIRTTGAKASMKYHA
jgi:hypothetical protein